MAAFVERHRCPSCGSGAITTLLSRDFSHPSVWSFLERRYEGRVSRRELAGRRHEVARCALCQLLFHRFVLSDTALARLYDEWTGEPERGSSDGALGSLPEPPVATRVLDLGAGEGEFCAAAREAGCEVIAVEVAPRQLEQLRDQGFDAYARVEEIECSDLGLARCHQILEHLPRPLETLRAIAGRLAPGGRIELSVPDASRLSQGLPCAFWSAGNDALRPLEHVNGFTQQSLQRLAQQVGLSYRAPRAVGWERVRRPTTMRLTLERPAAGGISP
jgi:SAM-dependent methyltransferase